MKEIEATRLKLKALELVEGTELDWWKAIKFHPDMPDKGVTIFFQERPVFHYSRDCYELALGIIEGKPVWAGNNPYCNGIPLLVNSGQTYDFTLQCWSWLPPTPKTALVELLVEDIEYWKNINHHSTQLVRLDRACRKTLEQLK